MTEKNETHNSDEEDDAGGSFKSAECHGTGLTERKLPARGEAKTCCQTACQPLVTAYGTLTRRWRVEMVLVWT